MVGENGTPETPDWQYPRRPFLEDLYHGTCPKCREWKFIGHGPLCGDCYAACFTEDLAIPSNIILGTE